MQLQVHREIFMRHTIRRAAAAVWIVSALFIGGTAYAVDWKFWEEKQQEAPPEPVQSRPEEPRPPEKEVPERESEPEKRVAKPPQKTSAKAPDGPVTPRKLGDEIEQVMAAIDLYRSEIEAKKKELDELKDKRLKLGELDTALAGEKDRKERKKLLAERMKLSSEVDDLARRSADNETQIRERKAAIAGLEKSVEVLRLRQQAVYLRYLYRILIVIGGFLLAWGIAHAATSLVNRIVREESRRAGLRKVVTGTVYAAAVVLALLASLENPAQLAAFVAVLSAGLAIALKDLLSCCIGWFMLVFTRQIRVGDIIEIGPVRGRVIDISLLKTTMHEWKDYRETGRTIFFGNNFIFSYPLYNSSLREGDVLDSLEVRLPPGVDWHRCVLELRQRGEALREYAEIADFSVASAFEAGGAPVAIISFRARPDEIPRIRAMIGSIAAGIIWDATQG